MEVFYGQGVLHQIVNPECLFGGLALRAMPVSTAVVAVAYCATVLTRFLVASQNGSAAPAYFAQYL